MFQSTLVYIFFMCRREEEEMHYRTGLCQSLHWNSHESGVGNVGVLEKKSICCYVVAFLKMMEIVKKMVYRRLCFQW